MADAEYKKIRMVVDIPSDIKDDLIENLYILASDADYNKDMCARHTALELRRAFEEASTNEYYAWVDIEKYGNPKENGLYLVTLEEEDRIVDQSGFGYTLNKRLVVPCHYVVDEGWYTKDLWYLGDVKNIIAWMKRPEPYKGRKIK